VDEELAWQIRDLMWLVFSINPTSDSRGQLPYPNVVLSVALTPYSGTCCMLVVIFFLDHFWIIFVWCLHDDLRSLLTVVLMCSPCWAGMGVHRAVGLFKAWQVQSMVSHCQNGLLHKAGVTALLTNSILYNPTLPMPVVEKLLAMCFDGGGDDKEIGFDALTTAMEALSGEGEEKEGEAGWWNMPLPFTLKNVFEKVRQCKK
jgi:hypothetical protein